MQLFFPSKQKKTTNLILNQWCLPSTVGVRRATDPALHHFHATVTEQTELAMQVLTYSLVIEVISYWFPAARSV